MYTSTLNCKPSILESNVADKKKEAKKKKIAAREFRVWSPTPLLGLALSSLTTVDRTGHGAFC